MTRRATVSIGLLAACLAVPASAATGAKRVPAPARGTSAAKQAAAARPVGNAKPQAAPVRAAGDAKPQAGPARTAGDVKAQAGPAPGRTVAAPRRLEDIHIEGEIPAPQVLFVTARDQRRFTRFHHQRYLKTSLRVGEETPLPTRIATTRKPVTSAATR